MIAKPQRRGTLGQSVDFKLEVLMERRTLIWVIVGAVVLMAAGFYLSSVLNLSEQESSGPAIAVSSQPWT
jgi:hypothetical protein